MTQSNVTWWCDIDTDGMQQTVRLMRYDNEYCVFHGNKQKNNTAACAIWLYDIVMGLLQDPSVDKDEARDLLTMISKTSQQLADGALSEPQ